MRDAAGRGMLIKSYRYKATLPGYRYKGAAKLGPPDLFFGDTFSVENAAIDLLERAGEGIVDGSDNR